MCQIIYIENLYSSGDGKKVEEKMYIYGKKNLSPSHLILSGY